MTRMFALLAGIALTATIGVAANDGPREGGPGDFGPWSAPVNLGPIVNSGVTDAGPRISRDGLSLYFHSARGNAASNPDLYVSRRAAIDLPWEAPSAWGTSTRTPPMPGRRSRRTVVCCCSARSARVASTSSCRGGGRRGTTRGRPPSPSQPLSTALASTCPETSSTARSAPSCTSPATAPTDSARPGSISTSPACGATARGANPSIWRN
jgi:hypothetical protein